MPSTFQTLVFDPGGKTGWSWAHVHDNAVSTWDGGTLREPKHHSQVRAAIHHYYPLQDLYGPLYVVTESFEFRQAPASAGQRRGLELISREYIGVMELTCEDLGMKLHQQMPSAALDGISDEQLKLLGLYKTPRQEHKDEIAAHKHNVLFLNSTMRIEKGIVDKWMGLLDD